MVEIAPELEAQVVAWRRHLHAHPERSFEEHETSRFVHDTLAAVDGLELSRPTATSVVATLRGARPGKTLALRADIDALPIQEENTFEFASVHPGTMHACGHDGHTAMLLAVARILAARREELSGEVRLIFQLAEEKPPGGARELVAAGVVDGVDIVVGAHLWSGLETGKVAVPVGPFTAAADTFSIEIRGQGTHAAFPHLGVDPIPVAAQVVTSLQQIVSRETDPLDRAVVSVTRIAGGTADNVIPERVELGGTARTFTGERRASVRASIERVVQGVTSAHRAEATIDYVEGYGPVSNDAEVAAVVDRAARAELGDGAIASIEPIMGGEDFSAYLTVAPGVFFIVGAQNDALGANHPHHHPRFTVDEAAFGNGIRVFVRTALDILGDGA
jgi:amidohydrolase